MNTRTGKHACGSGRLLAICPPLVGLSSQHSTGQAVWEQGLIGEPIPAVA
jgi:hypothetical protein